MDGTVVFGMLSGVGVGAFYVIIVRAQLAFRHRDDIRLTPGVTAGVVFVMLLLCTGLGYGLLRPAVPILLPLGILCGVYGATLLFIEGQKPNSSAATSTALWAAGTLLLYEVVLLIWSYMR